MRRCAALAVVAVLLSTSFALLVGPSTGSADHHESFTDFEPAGFTPGESVHNHQPDGNEADPPIEGINPDVQAWSVRQAGVDEEVVDLTATDPAHAKVWRLSDASDTGNLQLRPHAPKYLGFSGESDAIDDFGSETVTSNIFYAEFDFRSATGTPQAGLAIDVAAACGDDCRHGYVRMVDDAPNGFDLSFFETGAGGFGEFLTIPLDLNLSYTDWHTIGIAITFVDGQNLDGTGNDVVELYVNDELVHTGTTWETGYRISTASVRGVDRLAFSRSSIALAPVGGGLYFDNVLITDEISVFSVGPSTNELCYFQFTGQLISPTSGQCPPGSIAIETPSDDPLTFCINRFTNGVRYSASGQCTRNEIPHVVPQDGDLLTCVSMFTGQHRHVTDHAQCAWFETPNLIPAGAASAPAPPSRGTQ